MNRFELIKLTESICRALSNNDINPADVRYLRLYEEYVRMKKEGRKFSYILYYLSDLYKIGETTVWRIIKRFEKEVK